MAEFVYCYDTTKKDMRLPPAGVPVICVFRSRGNSGKIVGVGGFAMRIEDIFTERKYWVRLNSAESECVPFAWLDTGKIHLDESELFNLSKDGVLPLCQS